MSVNFGYSNYGMNMLGNSMNMQNGNTFQSIENQYSCPMCYQNGPVPYNYRGNVNPLPRNAIHPNWFNRIISRIFGF